MASHKILPQRFVIAIHTDLPRGAQKTLKLVAGNKIRIIQFVVADADVHVHKSIMRGGAGDERPKRSGDRAHVEIERAGTR